MILSRKKFECQARCQGLCRPQSAPRLARKVSPSTTRRVGALGQSIVPGLRLHSDRRCGVGRCEDQADPAGQVKLARPGWPGATPSPGGAKGDAFSGLTETGGGGRGCGVLPAAAGRRLPAEHGKDVTARRGGRSRGRTRRVTVCHPTNWGSKAPTCDLTTAWLKRTLPAGKSFGAHAIAASVGARIAGREDSRGGLARPIRRTNARVSSELSVLSCKQKRGGSVRRRVRDKKAHQVSQKLLVAFGSPPPKEYLSENAT